MRSGRLGLLLVWLALGAHWIWWVPREPVAVTSDVLGFAWLAERLTLERPESLANGFYPFGFPLLLRLLWPLTGDHLVSARLLSALGAWTSLPLAAALARRAFAPTARGAWLAVGIAVLLLPEFWLLSHIESIDMTALPLVLGALLLAADAPREPHRWLLAGAVAGAACLLRHHLLLLGPVLLLHLWLGSRGWAGGLRRRALLALCAGFALVAGPQWAVSAWVHGNPLHTLQAYNVGKSAVRTDWFDVPALLEQYRLPTLLREHPGALLRNWLRNAAGWLSQTWLPWAALALALACRDPARRAPARALLLFLGLWAAATSMAHLLHRTVLSAHVVAVSATVGGLWRLLALAPGWGPPRWLPRAAAGALLAAFALLFVARPLAEDRAQLSRVADRMAQEREIWRFLRARGVRAAEEVLSTHALLSDPRDPRRRLGYTWGGWLHADPRWRELRPLPPHPAQPGALLGFMRERGLRFLLIEREMELAAPLYRYFHARCWDAPVADRVLFDCARPPAVAEGSRPGLR